MIYDEFLHSGIKGMKWGVRRYQNDDGTYTSLGLERRRSERSGRRGVFGQRTSADRPQMRRARSMSNDELRRATERMRLENAYRQALRESSAGQSYAAQMMRDVGKNTVSSFTGGAANTVGQAVGKAIVGNVGSAIAASRETTVSWNTASTGDNSQFNWEPYRS